MLAVAEQDVVERECFPLVKATHPVHNRFIGTKVSHLASLIKQSPPGLKHVLHTLPLDFSCLSFGVS